MNDLPHTDNQLCETLPGINAGCHCDPVRFIYRDSMYVNLRKSQADLCVFFNFREIVTDIAVRSFYLILMRSGEIKEIELLPMNAVFLNICLIVRYDITNITQLRSHSASVFSTISIPCTLLYYINISLLITVKCIARFLKPPQVSTSKRNYKQNLLEDITSEDDLFIDRTNSGFTGNIFEALKRTVVQSLNALTQF